ncbi:MAG: hypothetical protein M3Z25_10295 [Actinomycetota bacterium]|nr:hypothetical protein [Actinomycetota bacterium]
MTAVMAQSSTRRFHFTTQGVAPFGPDWERLSDADFRDRCDRLDSLGAVIGSPPEWAWDLLRIARAVFLVDKRFRRQVPDGWTRTIELSVQVLEPGAWTSLVRQDLNALLGMLTSDVWRVAVHGGAVRQEKLPHAKPAAEIALFSGGLDSTSYAAQAAQREEGPLVLIGYDDFLKARQTWLCEAIKSHRRRKVELHQIGQRPRTRSRGEPLELSSRSRGFLYTATAVCAAASHGLTEVAVPENGQLAVNPALTPSRLAALSTRSVHPWTLHRINRVITGLGGEVTVRNPLLNDTKGRVCADAVGAGLDPRSVMRTVSCSRPRRARQAVRRSYHCGRCYPCLVRRSGLLNGLGEDTTDYVVGLPDLDPAAESSDDLRALLRWLCTDFTLHDLIADAPFPPELPPSRVLPVVRAGRRELAAMIEHLLPSRSPFRRDWQPHL